MSGQQTSATNRRNRSPKINDYGRYGGSTDPETLWERSLRDHRPLPLEREVELGKMAYKHNDENAVKAKKDLAAYNIRFATSVARQYQDHPAMERGCLNLMDLVQAANEGLVKAAQLYDPTRGFKFISFAAPYVRTAIRELLYNHSQTVRIPEHVIKRNKVINAYIRSQIARTGMMPSFEEISENIDLSMDIVKETVYSVQPMASLDGPINPGDVDDSIRLIDTIAISEPSSTGLDKDQQDMYDLILKNMQFLPETYRNVITLLYGMDGSRIERTPQEVAEKLTISRGRVLDIKNLALHKLRRYCLAQKRGVSTKAKRVLC